MTTHVYRYQATTGTLDLTEVNRVISPAFPVSVAQAWMQPFVDVSADDSTKGDLDYIMGQLGWTFVSTDPTTSAASPIFDIIWRPTATSSGNIAGTFADVQALVDAVQGVARIYVDTTLGPATIPSGSWSGYGSVELLSYNAASFLVTVADGALLVDYAQIRGITVLCECVTTKAFNFTANFSEFFIKENAAIAIDASATVAAIQNGQTLSVFFDEGTLDNTAKPTVGVIETLNGGTTRFYPHNAAQNLPVLLTGNEISGPVGSTVFWENDASVPALASTLFLGTVNQVPNASNLGPNVLSSGPTPSVVPGAATGVGATTVMAAGSNDNAGRVDVTTGTGSGAGDYAVVTFATPYLSAPKAVVVGGANVNVPNDILPYVPLSSLSANGFTIATPDPGVDSTLFQLYYIVVG
jgi:hypothetical protein